MGVNHTFARFRAGAVRGLVAAGLLAVQASAFAAIAVFTVPNGLDGVEGDSASSLPFGDTAACSNGFRYQQVINGDQGLFGTIGSIAFRLDGGAAPVGPLTYGNTTVTLSSTDRTAATLSTNFEENVGLDRQVVWSGDLQIDAAIDAIGTNPFDILVVDGGGFRFGDTGDNLLIDIVVEGCPLGAAFFMDAVAGSSATRAVFSGDIDSDVGSPAQGLVAEVVASTPPPVPPLYDCPVRGTGGDRPSRGIYLENFPTNQLGRVTLNYRLSDPGQYRVELTARQGSYDGAVIGSQDRVFAAQAADALEPVTFDFRNASVAPGSTVTFTQRVISQPAGADIFFDLGEGPCTDVFETNGTAPPLDSFRRDSVGITVLPSSAETRPLGLGGNWTVVGRDAEGFMIDVTDRNQLVAIWFTYDDDGTQMWMIGTAQQFDRAGAAMDLFRTDGPTFEQIRQIGFDNSLIDIEPWGGMYLRFLDCNSATVAWRSTTGFGQGDFEIERLYETESNLCP
ncbi:hypothetical protein HFP89_15270 [Wenzhouxiangella sp. XN79A]|uniref:hypothetical protein n=1 Tax=Wenzhouxiangella sp. XN79A TaxID=2724193 RepID=UPI00144ABB1B|nr:hypothetical protein [Wenzhouxiangella sp. XN79A]NKI36530.1 hypothetical protein [Wenzhouxiangella sp. XN79A]